MRREPLDLSAKTITAQRHLICKDTEAFTHVKDSNAHVRGACEGFEPACEGFEHGLSEDQPALLTMNCSMSL